MKLPILIFMVCVIGFVLAGGCTNTASTPPEVTPTMEQPATPTVQVPATLVQSTMPVSATYTVCGGLVSCGDTPTGVETQPVKSEGNSSSGRWGNEESGWDRSLQQTSDSGYIVSGGINAEVSPGHGSEDMWVVKLNPVGTIQWQQALGGSDREESFSIRETLDGGYILTGVTDSDNTGDVGPNHGGSDIWVVKLKPSGGIQWQKVLGGKGFESGKSIYPTTDGGYILTGVTDSDNTGDVGPNHGGSDIWVVKLNQIGDIQWQQVLGGEGDESGRSILPTAGGEYILTGFTDSDNTGDVGPNHGGSDIWVVKLTPAGTILWQQVLGGSDREESFSIRQTLDTGFVLTGVTDSDNTGDVGPNHGGSDIWVVKLNPAGTIQWQKVLGGKAFESGRSIDPTTDGGYILTGVTDSDNTGDVGPNHGGSDIWVVKLFQTGDIQWQKVLGGDGDESGRSIQQTADGLYILSGVTDPDNTGNVGPNNGGSAIWLVKLNPVGTIEWQQVLGENG